MAHLDYDKRIVFHRDEQIMEVDFSNLTFDVSKPVNDFYDEIDRRIEESGQRWFFLVNYLNCQIMPEAWIVFAHRGKKANLACSLGSARFAASDTTSEAILESSKQERFDPNLFESRKSAVAHLRELRCMIPKEEFASRIKLDPPAPGLSYETRIAFHDDLQILEVDFGDVTFEGSRDVNAFYDVIDRKLMEKGGKWFFLINYRNCSILPDAWIAFSTRGRRVNLGYSLGSVRFGAREEIGESILKDARDKGFDPNLVSSRQVALERIAELRRNLPAQT